jgi:hypothetical protein
MAMFLILLTALTLFFWPCQTTISLNCCSSGLKLCRDDRFASNVTPIAGLSSNRALVYSFRHSTDITGDIHSLKCRVLELTVVSRPPVDVDDSLTIAL